MPLSLCMVTQFVAEILRRQRELDPLHGVIRAAAPDLTPRNTAQPAASNMRCHIRLKQACAGRLSFPAWSMRSPILPLLASSFFFGSGGMGAYRRRLPFQAAFRVALDADIKNDG